MDSRELTLNKANYTEKIENLVNEKKSFIVHLYGDILENTGKSWCPDCVKAEPILAKAKEEIFYKNKEKEIYFINIPIPRCDYQEYKANKILKVMKIPTITYYYKGKEIARLVEGELFDQNNVDGFFNDIFKED